MFPSISPSRYRSSFPVSSPRITTDFPIWPTSALSVKVLLDFAVSFGGVLKVDVVALAALDDAAEDAPCAWFVLIGLLSSGLAFHMKLCPLLDVLVLHPAAGISSGPAFAISGAVARLTTQPRDLHFCFVEDRLTRHSRTLLMRQRTATRVYSQSISCLVRHSLQLV